MEKETATALFDKTLTQQQLDDFGYLNWDNDTLGRAVKAFASELSNVDANGFKGVKTIAACYLLIDLAAEANAGEMTLELSGYSSKKRPDVPLQKWVITVKQAE